MNETLKNKKNNALWKFPWEYRESFIIAAGILITGFFVESVAGSDMVVMPEWPLNLGAGLAYSGLLIVVHYLFRHNPFIRWISSIPACISAISVFGFMAILLGLFPASVAQPVIILRYINLSQLSHSYPFLFSQLYFVTVLGFVVLRRALPVKGRNIGFLLNHGGLWIIIFAAMVGSGDLKRLMVDLYENRDFQKVAADHQFKQHTLPFSLRLIDFNIEQYNPELVIFDYRTSEYVIEGKRPAAEIKKGLTIRKNWWNIYIKKYLESSIPGKKGYVSSGLPGASPAAFIYAFNMNTSDSVSGWITCGSYSIPPKVINLDNRYYLAMTIPEPKEYSSLVEVNEPGKSNDTIRLIVNKPVKIKGWKLYQTGYNTQMGKWSDISVIELVKDPWLPVVYTGIFILLAGAVYMFWIGKEIKE